MQIDVAQKIKNKAIELGYEDCGIIPISDMTGYKEKLTERILRFPEVKSHSEEFYSFAELEKLYPWAKSIVVCVRQYGKYRIPNNLQGIIGKYYLCDSRRNTQSRDHKESILFEEFLVGEGIQTRTNRDFGITALRWAARKAELGIVRKNNFFYSNHGSWVNIEAWLIDKELEIKEQVNLKKCPTNCKLCINACPTNSLAEPYMMNRNTCISCLTTWEGWDLPNDEHRQYMGNWIYGCDMCQDICPFNKDKWEELYEFPELENISNIISYEKIIEMDYRYLRDYIQPKFWYISKEHVWRWKTNSLNAMLNNYKENYLSSIEKACHDENYHVRTMANWVKKKICSYS